MSKSYPNSKRKYDLFLAVGSDLLVGQVLFYGKRRIVLRERYNREEWMAARAVDKSHNRRGKLGELASERVMLVTTTDPEPGPELGYFYGRILYEAANRKELVPAAGRGYPDVRHPGQARRRQELHLGQPGPFREFCTLRARLKTSCCAHISETLIFETAFETVVRAVLQACTEMLSAVSKTEVFGWMCLVPPFRPSFPE